MVQPGSLIEYRLQYFAFVYSASLIGNYTSRNGVFSVPRRDKARRRVIGPGAFSFALADYLH